MPGPRTVAIDRGIVYLDGRRRFLKGARLSPRGVALTGSKIDIAGLLTALAGSEANMVVVDPRDAVRPLFDVADDLGLLVFVDRPSAALPPFEAVRHRHSFAGWYAERRLGGAVGRARGTANDGSGHPTLVVPLPQRLGWADGDERDLPESLRRRGRGARFLGGFGAPSVAVDDPWLDDPDRWRTLGESTVPATDVDDVACVLRHTPPAAFDDAAAWAAATCDYQAMVVRFHIEAARRRKYAYLGGVAPDVLGDPSGGLSPALFDAASRPKPAFTALTAAYRPIVAIADRLPPHLHGNEALALDVHVVNDSDRLLERGSVSATLTWSDGVQRYEFGVQVPPDDVRRVGTIQLVVPPVSGRLRLAVELHLDGDVVTSRYESEIFAEPHDHGTESR